MCDLIGLYFLVRHVRTMAEQKGHPSSNFVAFTVTTYLALEIAGAIAGYVFIGGQFGAMALGLAGIIIALMLIMWRLHALPDLNRDAPVSFGHQVVGRTCVACEKGIVSAMGAQKCEKCGAACHESCVAAHMRMHAANAAAAQKTPATQQVSAAE